MELLIFGRSGPPIIVFPSSSGSFFEFEDRGIVAVLADKLEHGGLQLFCVSSVDDESWHHRPSHPRDRVRRHLQYEDYILNDVVPLVAHLSSHDGIGVTGCGFGAYHAMVLALRQPYTFTACVAISGSYDISAFMDGYDDEDCYFLNPQAFVANLSDPYYLEQYRRNKFVLAAGEHDICRPATESFAGLLRQKGIPHSLHVWGDGARHDWAAWRRMASAYLP